jgi:hypothetical protein
MHLAGPVPLLIHLAALVAADTEIFNFRSGQTVSRALAVVEFSLVLVQMIARKIISHPQVLSLHLSSLHLSFPLLPRQPEATQFRQAIKNSTDYVKSRRLMYKMGMEVV